MSSAFSFSAASTRTIRLILDIVVLVTMNSAGDSDDGGYDLIAAAGDWHVNSTFAGTKVVERRTGTPPVTLHPDDAARDGLAEGDRVLVANQLGSFTALLQVHDSARPGTAVASKGWWTLDLNATVDERDSDMAQGAVFHDNRVQITRA